MRVWLVVGALAGCGFHPSSSSDLAAADLAGADLAGASGDLASGDLATLSGTGPGALGALPTGFCCAGDSECRGRRCGAIEGCLDACGDNQVCQAYTSQSTCNPTVGLCSGGACLDPTTFHHGLAATGTCCTSDAQQRGAECAGGWCIRTGNPPGPPYCSQGCTSTEPCPAGFTCALRSNGAMFDYFQCCFNASFNSQAYICR